MPIHKDTTILVILVVIALIVASHNAEASRQPWDSEETPEATPYIITNLIGLPEATSESTVAPILPLMAVTPTPVLVSPFPDMPGFVVNSRAGCQSIEIGIGNCC